MVKKILGGIAGYLVMALAALAGVALTWFAVGGGTGAFAGEGPAPSTLWIASNLVFGLIAAATGGWLASRVGGAGGLKCMIGFVIVLGLVAALGAETRYAGLERVDKPVAEMTFMEAGQHARSPAWYNWVIPVVGVIGAGLGGRKRASSND